MHVGLDTVALAGAGFSLLTHPGARVRTGDPLMRLDLDFLARHARSLVTPVIVTGEGTVEIVRRSVGRELATGDFLMEIAREAAQPTAHAPPAPLEELTRRAVVTLAHGLHARPAAVLAAAIKNLPADARIVLRGRAANARSTVALMGLGVQRGDEIELRASGPAAARALEALTAALLVATERERTAPPPNVASRGPAAAETAPAPPGTLGGISASRGLAVGAAVQLRRAELQVAEGGGGEALEGAALERARASVRARLERRSADTRLAPAAREITIAHLELMDDPEVVDAARAGIAQGKSASFAWRRAIRAQVEALSALPDARLRERADDLLDLESQVLIALAGLAATPVPQLPAEAIVIARELLPSQLVALDATRLAGIALAQGGATSHVAILAAAMGVPAVVALGAPALEVPEGTTVVLDADEGRLEIEPSAVRLTEVRAALTERGERARAARAAAQAECRTADGVRIGVYANIGSVAEAEAAVRNGAEGCGLLRTEFLFLERESAPAEAEQVQAYQAIADVLGGRPLTIRTLDAGGDKPIAYLRLPAEENPALGLRGVRTSLAYPELLRTQLRAVLRVTGPAQVRLLLPMIVDLTDLNAVLAQLEEARRELGRSATVPVGIMIETPASAVLSAPLAAAADFFSVGTNDLTQYTLAMDRGHPQLAPRLDALHPAVLELIARAARATAARGKHTAVCGGLASEPLAARAAGGTGRG